MAGMRPSDVAWCVLGVAVLLYEAMAPRGELLSQAVYRYRESRPILTRAVVAALALHLLSAVPRWMDPFVLTYVAYSAVKQAVIKLMETV